MPTYIVKRQSLICIQSTSFGDFVTSCKVWCFLRHLLNKSMTCNCVSFFFFLLYSELFLEERRNIPKGYINSQTFKTEPTIPRQKPKKTQHKNVRLIMSNKNPTKAAGYLRCSILVSSFWTTCDTRFVAHVSWNPVISQNGLRRGLLSHH